MLSSVIYRVIKAASIAEKKIITRVKKAFYCLYLHFDAFLKGEIPYILVFEYNILRHTWVQST
jgi:hypothetical protein